MMEISSFCLRKGDLGESGKRAEAKVEENVLIVIEIRRCLSQCYCLQKSSYKGGKGHCRMLCRYSFFALKTNDSRSRVYAPSRHSFLVDAKYPPLAITVLESF